ncbi:MAG: hypothetical protein F6K41_08420 [Symploca sp. SIO3E6]|nr:hypothetical protein [Caldora sp. SIO3E6]
MIVAWLLAAIGLPLSIYCEFIESDTWLFYFRIYPHMILFPLLFLGAAFVSIYQALILVVNKQEIARTTAVILCLSTWLLCIELTSDNMMLFEFNQTASTTREVPVEIIEEIKKIPNIIIDTNKIINKKKIIINKTDIEESFKKYIKHNSKLEEKEKKGYYEFMKLSLSYQTWKSTKQWSSFNRWLYASSFFIIVTGSLINISLIFLHSRQQLRNQSQYIYHLAVSSLLFIAWMPLRIYYNISTNNLLFGSDLVIGNMDIFAWIIYPIYLISIILKIHKIRQDWIAIVMVSIIGIFLPLIGIFKTKWIDVTFGLHSTPVTWIVGLFIGWFIFYVFNQRAKHQSHIS